MGTDHNLAAFYALLCGGLWETEVRLAEYGSVDFKRIFEIAKEQTVIGLVAVGMEHVVDRTITKDDAAKFIHSVVKTEIVNKAMNGFIAKLVTYLRDNDISPLLVKGQGLAQCYERPLWRMAGDVDFIVPREEYKKAVDILKKIASSFDNERDSDLHISLDIGNGIVEMHGTLDMHYLKRVDRVMDEILRNTFENNEVRIWTVDKVPIEIPKPDNDVIFVFTHILKHSFIGGVGLRQVCDWCRLLYSFKDEIDASLLQERLTKMGLMREWKTFAALAVRHLGMNAAYIPLYDPSPKWDRNA
ncbi:MAG: nucleotidyltransferase family protein, partial [Bacteroidales bacterium]|nr:nucleotidyltransferase family protein [Bacteroidales bacterium]